MAKSKKDLSKEKEATLFEMFDYLCSRVDFSKAFLDGASIVSMNALFIELEKDTKKYKL